MTRSKGIAAQGFLHGLAVESRRHAMSSLAHFLGLGGEVELVQLAIENLDRG